MNTPNPLQPLGTLPTKATSQIGFKILMILAIHVVVIGGLLLQGCSKDKASTNKDSETVVATNSSPMSTSADVMPATPATTTAGTTTSLPPVSAPAPVTAPMTAPATVAPVMTPTAPMPPVAAPVVASGVAKEYVIASGDTFGAIAKRNGVSLKALLEANPGVDPKKLQISHKIQIPAGTALVASSATSGAATADAAPAAVGDGSIYVVKAGDRLLKIAASHGTTVKAILEKNDMKTTAIRVNQKLKMPVMKVASAETAPVSAPASGAMSGAAPAMHATTAN